MAERPARRPAGRRRATGTARGWRQDLALFTDLYELSMMRVYRAFRMRLITLEPAAPPCEVPISPALAACDAVVRRRLEAGGRR